MVGPLRKLAEHFGRRGIMVVVSDFYDDEDATLRELRAVAATHGWSLDPLTLFEMVPADGLGEDHEQTLLHPSEVELGETIRDVIAKVDELRPARVVIDSCFWSICAKM